MSFRVGCQLAVYGTTWNESSVYVNPLELVSLLRMPTDPPHNVNKVARVFAAMEILWASTILAQQLLCPILSPYSTFSYEGHHERKSKQSFSQKSNLKVHDSRPVSLTELVFPTRLLLPVLD